MDFILEGYMHTDVILLIFDVVFQSHPGVAKYKDNPWPYWDDLSPLMSSSPKQSHVLNPQHKHCQKDTATAMAAGPSNTPANEVMAIDNPITTAPTVNGTATPSISPGPLPSTSFINSNASSASTPSAYFSHPPQSTISMASTMMTSISQKKKIASTPGSNIISDGPKK